jgi:hypothetical protein
MSALTPEAAVTPADELAAEYGGQVAAEAEAARRRFIATRQAEEAREARRECEVAEARKALVTARRALDLRERDRWAHGLARPERGVRRDRAAVPRRVVRGTQAWPTGTCLRIARSAGREDIDGKSARDLIARARRVTANGW